MKKTDLHGTLKSTKHVHPQEHSFKQKHIWKGDQCSKSPSPNATNASFIAGSNPGSIRAGPYP